MSNKQALGDPFADDAIERARRHGTIGGRRREPEPEPEEKTRPARIPRTYQLLPEVARWVKRYAAEHDLQTSDLVNMALQEYRDRHDG